MCAKQKLLNFPDDFILKTKCFIVQALTTAVWSVLKAKRKMLKFPHGFMSHFYAISEQMSPLMAWGFLGPDEKLKDICQFFKVNRFSLLVLYDLSTKGTINIPT